MVVLSLFDGMSCGQIALEKVGFSVTKYYAAEIDRYAVSVTKANYPNTIHLGDVTKWREWEIDWSTVDLLIGGSPCQGFSFAGKQLAFDDPRSALFFVYVDILNHIKEHNPNVKYMLENIRMKQQYMDVITEYLGVAPVFINSCLVSAQNRQRWYWANFEFDIPEDKGLTLSSVLEDGFVDQEKSYCLDANYFKGGNLKSYFEKHRRQLVFCGAIRGRYNEEGKVVQQLELRYDGKTNALTTVTKDNQVVWLNDPDDTTVTYRKLTPLECERLQTVPEGYTAHVSNTQRYKMLGNGWTVDVIAAIFKGLSNEE